MRDAKFSYHDYEAQQEQKEQQQQQPPPTTTTTTTTKATTTTSSPHEVEIVIRGGKGKEGSSEEHEEKANKDKTRRESVKINDMNMGTSEIEQGKVVTIIGAKSQGKATIMRLIAGEIFPTIETDAEHLIHGRCTLFVPPHLRIVQVTENPLIFDLSVFKNMAHGIKPSPGLDWAAIKVRARNIAKRLGLSPELTDDEFFEADGKLGQNGCRITRADRQLISIGRALVMNPEVIVCHKPTALLDEAQTDATMDMFRVSSQTRPPCYCPTTTPFWAVP